MTKKILEEFNAMKPLNIYVTDSPSNMRAAFCDYVGCCCHNLNLVLLNSLQDDGKEDGIPKEVYQLIITCKELSAHAKRTKIYTLLQNTLKQCYNSLEQYINDIEINKNEHD